MPVTVETGARLHFGFRNLSPKAGRLFGSLGVALAEPEVVVTAEPASTVHCEHETAAAYAGRATELLGVAGAHVTVESTLPRHVGLGSGTQLALATLTAIARAYGKEPRIREYAPALDRGLRSGIGVAAFEHGGFIVDGGQPADLYEEDGPLDSWSVPPVATRLEFPEEWRFLLVQPEAEPGKSGQDEADSIQSTISNADPKITDRIETTITERVIPGVEYERIESFGVGLSTIDRLNGSWFVDEQGDVYRPPVDAIIHELGASSAVFGTGQSSWGPAVYGLTDRDHETQACEAGLRALSRAGVDGDVSIYRPRNQGVMTDGNKPSIKY